MWNITEYTLQHIMKTIILTVLISTIISISIQGDLVYGRDTRGKNNIGLMPFPRVGRTFNDKLMERNLIPYPRVGRAPTIGDNYVLVPLKENDYSKDPDTKTDKFLTYGFMWKDDDVERSFYSNAL